MMNSKQAQVLVGEGAGNSEVMHQNSGEDQCEERRER